MTLELNNVYQGNCLDLIKQIPSHSIDAVITDPPYPNVTRDYGYWTSVEWFALMKPLVMECKRVLKPTGSAVFILQPNSEKVGKIRPWLWEFMAWACQEWNMIQDVYWWNYTSIPTVHSQAKYGLMRPSIKPMVWLGAEDCYRNQSEILLTESDTSRKIREAGRLKVNRVFYPSGFNKNDSKIYQTSVTRGGVTPFNLIPVNNADSATSAGAAGHGAGTPYSLCEWWIKYICPENGIVLDPFMGAGTVAQAAKDHNRQYLGFEQYPDYVQILKQRGLMFDSVEAVA